MGNYFTSHNQPIRVAPLPVSKKASNILAANTEEMNWRRQQGSDIKQNYTEQIQALRDNAAVDEKIRSDNETFRRSLVDFYQQSELTKYKQEADNLRLKAENPQSSALENFIQELAPKAAQLAFQKGTQVIAGEKQLAQETTARYGIDLQTMNDLEFASKTAEDFETVSRNYETQGKELGFDQEQLDWYRSLSSYEKHSARKAAVQESWKSFENTLLGVEDQEVVIEGRTTSLDEAMQGDDKALVVSVINNLVAAIKENYFKEYTGSKYGEAFLEKYGGQMRQNLYSRRLKLWEEGYKRRQTASVENRRQANFESSITSGGASPKQIAATYHGLAHERSKLSPKSYGAEADYAHSQLIESLRTGQLSNATEIVDAIGNHEIKDHPAFKGPVLYRVAASKKMAELRRALDDGKLVHAKEQKRQENIREGENLAALGSAMAFYQVPENLTMANIKKQQAQALKDNNTKLVQYLERIKPLTPIGQNDQLGMEHVRNSIKEGSVVSQDWINAWNFSTEKHIAMSSLAEQHRASDVPEEILKAAKASLEGEFRIALSSKTSQDIVAGDYQQAVLLAVREYKQLYKAAYTSKSSKDSIETRTYAANTSAISDVIDKIRKAKDPNDKYYIKKYQKGQRANFANILTSGITPEPYGQEQEDILRKDPNAITTTLLVDYSWLQTVTRHRRIGRSIDTGPQIRHIAKHSRKSNGKPVSNIEAFNYQAKLAIDAGYPDIELIGEDYVQKAEAANNLVPNDKTRLATNPNVHNTGVILEENNIPRESVYPEFFAPETYDGGYSEEIWRRYRNMDNFAIQIFEALSNGFNTNHPELVGGTQ